MSTNEEEEPHEGGGIKLDKRVDPSLSGILSSGEYLVDRAETASILSQNFQDAGEAEEPVTQTQQGLDNEIEEEVRAIEQERKSAMLSSEPGAKSGEFVIESDFDEQSTEKTQPATPGGASFGSKSHEASMSIEDDFESFESPVRTPVDGKRPQTTESALSPMNLEMDEEARPGTPKERRNATFESLASEQGENAFGAGDANEEDQFNDGMQVIDTYQDENVGQGSDGKAEEPCEAEPEPAMGDANPGLNNEPNCEAEPAMGDVNPELNNEPNGADAEQEREMGDVNPGLVKNEPQGADAEQEQEVGDASQGLSNEPQGTGSHQEQPDAPMDDVQVQQTRAQATSEQLPETQQLEQPVEARETPDNDKEAEVMSGSPPREIKVVSNAIKAGNDESSVTESQISVREATDDSQFQVSSVRLEMPEVASTQSRPTRRSGVMRPKTSIGRLPLGSGASLDFKRIARISQRAHRPSNNVPDYFIEMILGPQKSRYTTTAWEMHESVQESHREVSPYTQEESAQIARDLVNGKKRRIVNAAGIADVIDELTALQVQSMEAGDYRQTCKVRMAIQNLRQNFRKQDRDRYHKARLDTLKQQISEAESQLAEAKARWKAKEADFKATRNTQAKELDAKHDQELRDCKEQWSDERTTRRYNKRSPLLLNRMFVEKQLLLLGEYTEATQQRKINIMSEKEETSEKFREYTASFEGARNWMLKKHETEVTEFNKQKELQWQILLKRENAEIERHTKRVESLKRILEEEGDLANFVAKKFKKGPEMILPLSATCDGGEDIPTMGKTRKEQGSTSVWIRFREAGGVTALSLPPLKFKKIRNKPRAYVEVKKKEKVDL